METWKGNEKGGEEATTTTQLENKQFSIQVTLVGDGIPLASCLPWIFAGRERKEARPIDAAWPMCLIIVPGTRVQNLVIYSEIYTGVTVGVIIITKIGPIPCYD